MPDSSSPVLPSFSWVGQLRPDDLELLSSHGEFFPGNIGQIIIEEGALQTEVIVVITGRLEVRARQEPAGEIILAHLGPGETLGEISLFNPGPANASVIASEFSQLWRIRDDDLIEFMEENPGAGIQLLRTLAAIFSQRLRQTYPRAFGLSSYSVIQTPELGQLPDAPLDPA